MLSSVVLAVGLVVAIPVPEGPEPVELFAGEAWYKDQAGKEQEFTGVLVEFKQAGKVGFGRYNPFRLVITGDRKDLREVYLGGKPDLLRAHVGKKVKIVGKAVDMEVEGRQHREIWPARLFVLDEEKVPEAKANQRLIDALRGQLTLVEARRKELEAAFNQPIQDKQQAITMKMELGDLYQQTQELQGKINELEQPAGRPGDARLEEMKARLAQQRANVERVQAEVVEIQAKVAAIRGQQNVAPEVFKKLEAITAESEARLDAERQRLAVQEQEYQRALRLPPPPRQDQEVIPPQGNAGADEKMRAMVEEMRAIQAESVALAQKAQAVNDPNAAKELLARRAQLQQKQQAIAQEILQLRGAR